MTDLFPLALIIYHVEQFIFGAVAIILLENWVQNGLKKQTTVKHDNVNIRSNNERDLQ
jgi:hypothetical protein